MARKKIVFIIVEGPSDEEALAVILNRLYDKNTVYVHIMHGDITTDRGVSATNVLLKIGNEVKQYASDNHYSKIHFEEIIHIVDMDGAFIPQNCIIKDVCEKPIYDLENIRTANPEGIINRNFQKCSIINRLHTTQTIWNLPYHVFFMSCNLDHVLHNKLDSSDEEKEHDSHRFAIMYKDDIPAFLAFICESDFSVLSGYRESWEFIKRGNNSLKRFTNLGLYFPKDTEKNLSCMLSETHLPARIGPTPRLDPTEFL